MKILLVNINREHLPDPVAPIGLVYVGGALLERDHRVELCDLCFADDPDAVLKAHLTAMRPDVVGVSIRNVDNAAFPNAISYLPIAQRAVATIRRHSRATVVLGGSAFSLLPAEFLSRLEVEFGVIGEGEETFTRLLDALDAGRNPDTVPGVAVRERTLGSFVPATPIRQPGKGLARGWELIDVDTYWQRSGQLPLQSKRGCAFGCTYCTYPKLEGHDTRSREVGAVVDEIERWVRDRRINHFFFVDNIFNSPIEHATLILEEILRRSLRIGWTAYVTPRVSTRAFSELMVRSGCRGVEVGVDGGSDTTMRSLNKGFRPEHVRQYFAHAHAAGLHTCCTLIFGAPGESRATLDETFELIDTIRPDAVVAMVGVRTYPGTGLWPVAVESGQVDPAADPLEPAFYISDELTDDDLKSILDRAAARANWVIPGENLGLDKELFARLRKKHIKGPLWRLMRRRQDGAARTPPQ